MIGTAELVAAMRESEACSPLWTESLSAAGIDLVAAILEAGCVAEHAADAGMPVWIATRNAYLAGLEVGVRAAQSETSRGPRDI